MAPRSLLAGIALLGLGLAACGGTPRATSADLAPVLQPTPDPTLDAVVRNLPRAISAASQPTPTPAAPKPLPATRKAPAPSVRATPTRVGHR